MVIRPSRRTLAVPFILVGYDGIDNHNMVTTQICVVMGNKNKLFSENQWAVIQDPEQVAANRRAMYRNRVADKVNGDLGKVIDYLPNLIEYLDSATKEELRLQSDPAYVGEGLGELYAEQKAELILGALLSERREYESTADFLERLDNIWAEVKTDIETRVRQTQRSHEFRQSYGQFQRELLDHVATHISATAEWSGVKMRVPLDGFVQWVVGQEASDEIATLREVFDAAFGISTGDPVYERGTVYRGALTTAAASEGLAPPVGSSWTFDLVSPAEVDFELHRAALAALDEELTIARHRYWEETRVQERDRLLATGLVDCAGLKKRDQEILRRGPCSNTSEGWTRYDTRRANVLANDRQPALLSEEITPKPGTSEKQYEPTEYGRFVRWLADYLDEKGGVNAVVRDFAQEAPRDLVIGALLEVDEPDFGRWVRVAATFDISES